MASSGPKITNITEAKKWFAVYLPDNEKEIPERRVPVICWASLEFEDDPDEVVGQIFDGNCITEVTSVDDEEGFGEFLGYYRSKDEADADIAAALSRRELEEQEEAEEEGEEEDGEGDEGDDEEDGEGDIDEDDEDEGGEEDAGEGDEEDLDEEDEDEGDEDDLEDEEDEGD